MSKSKHHAETIAVSAGVGADTAHGAVMPPLHLSANFTFKGFDEKRAYDYTRSGNPTRDVLADALAELEGGEGGIITGSGMSAINLVFALVQTGDTVVAPKDCYGGTHRLIEAHRRQGHFETTYVDISDLTEVEEAFAAKPKLVIVETPTNPLMRITDLEAICALAKQYGVLVAVDNTFLSPARQTPIAFGADIVIHSTTKYLNGHSDVVGGAVIAATKELHEELAWWANCTGVTGAPFDSYMTLRGLRTLFPRINQQEATAHRVATFLANAPQVKKVCYPGLVDHPGHAIAKRQQKGFGAMLSFELDGNEDDLRAFLSALDIVTLAESLGGVETLVAHPATMTHAAMDEAARARAGISNQLLRLSIGLEAADDVIADLNAGFAAVDAHNASAKPQAALAGE